MERGRDSPRRNQNASGSKNGPKNSEAAENPAQRIGKTGGNVLARTTLVITVAANAIWGTAAMRRAIAEMSVANESYRLWTRMVHTTTGARTRSSTAANILSATYANHAGDESACGWSFQGELVQLSFRPASHVRPTYLC